jgi:hypothetical protein
MLHCGVRWVHGSTSFGQEHIWRLQRLTLLRLNVMHHLLLLLDLMLHLLLLYSLLRALLLLLSQLHVLLMFFLYFFDSFLCLFRFLDVISYVNMSGRANQLL